MARAGLVWSNSPSNHLRQLAAAYTAAIRAAIRSLVDDYAARIEAWMKAHAPWTDRTGNARQTLKAEVEQLTRDLVQIVLSGGVDYFGYLELAHQGRFAIIAPALRRFTPHLWSEIRLILS